MKRLLIALTLVLMVLPATAWSMGSTLNKDFEAGFQDPTDPNPGAAAGWYNFTIGDPAAVTSGETTALYVHGGAASQKVDASAGGEGGVKGMFDVVAGGTYDVSVYCYAASGVAFFGVNGDANEDPLTVANWLDYATPEWTQLTRRVTATGDKITVFLDDWGGVTYWDDVTVTPVLGSTLEFEGGFQSNGVGNEWNIALPGTFSADNATRHGGAYSQKMVDSTGGGAGVTRDLAIPAGAIYTISAWVKVDSGTAYLNIGDAWPGVGVSDWQKVTLTGVSTGAVTVNLFATESGTMYWDDVAFSYETPLADPDGKAPYQIWWQEPWRCRGQPVHLRWRFRRQRDLRTDQQLRPDVWRPSGGRNGSVAQHA